MGGGQPMGGSTMAPDHGARPWRQGMTRTWPVLISLGSLIPFAVRIAATVIPNFAAMPLSVSPDRTVYRCVPAGAFVGAGVAFAGDGVGRDVGVDVGSVLAAGVADDEGVVGVAIGAGEPVAAEGAPVAAAKPEAPAGADGPCADGVVVRAITSTRNARTISATRSV
jgi:hypothetical protein